MPAAQYHLALLYLDGEGVRKDFEAAGKWFKAAAEKGDVDSMYNYALMLESGRLGDPDLPEAVKWMRKSAEAGVLPAKVSMGLLAFNGRGMERSDSEAFRWFKQAAEEGSAEGMFLYAVALSEGLGGKPKFGEALRWARKSVAASEEEPSQVMTERLGLVSQLEMVLDEKERIDEYQRRMAAQSALAQAQRASLIPSSEKTETPRQREIRGPVAEATQQVAGQVLATKKDQNDVRRKRGLRR